MLFRLQLYFNKVNIILIYIETGYDLFSVLSHKLMNKYQ